jgi:hypothetical protein
LYFYVGYVPNSNRNQVATNTTSIVGAEQSAADKEHFVRMAAADRFTEERVYFLACVIFALNPFYRCDEETMLRRMLNLPSFHVRIRGDPRPSNVIIEIVNINDDKEMERMGRAELTFVKTRAETEAFAAKWNVKCYHSKLSLVDKASALNDLSTMGTPIVATYGLSVGVNIKVKGKSVSSVDIYGMCPSMCWRVLRVC